MQSVGEVPGDKNQFEEMQVILEPTSTGFTGAPSQMLNF